MLQLVTSHSFPKASIRKASRKHQRTTASSGPAQSHAKSGGGLQGLQVPSEKTHAAKPPARPQEAVARACTHAAPASPLPKLQCEPQLLFLSCFSRFASFDIYTFLEWELKKPQKQKHLQALPYSFVEMLWETGPPGLAPTHQAHGSLGAGGLHGPNPSIFIGEIVQNLRVRIVLHSLQLGYTSHVTRKTQTSHMFEEADGLNVCPETLVQS